MGRDRYAESAQRLRRKQAGRRAGRREGRRQIPDLPHQLGLRPARQQLSAHHAAPGRERDRLSIVDDQVGAPTTSIELARATHAIVTGILAGRFGAPQEWCGLYHMTCAGSVSWFGFAQAIFARAAELLGVKAPQLTPIATRDYPTLPRALAIPSSPMPNCASASASSSPRGKLRSKRLFKFSKPEIRLRDFEYLIGQLVGPATSYRTGSGAGSAYSLKC